MSIKRKLESSQELTPFIAEQEFTELLWENGQIVMHGQSNRSRKNSYTDNFSHSSRFQERECRNAAIPKIVNFGATTDFMANEFVAAVPSGPMGLNVQESDVIPWMNYPMEDSIQNDYCSEFFSEISWPNSNLFSAHNNQVSADRNNCFTHIARDSHNVEHGHGPIPLAGRSEASRVRTNPLFQSPQEGQTSILNAKSRVLEFGISGRCFTSNDRNLQKQDVGTLKPPHISTGIGLMNFSHFSRPVTTVRSNLHSVDRLRSHEKPSSDTTSSNPVESMVLNSSDGLKNLPTVHAQPRTILPKIDLRLSANHSQEVFSIDRSEGVCLEDTSRSEHVNNISNANTSPSNHVNCRELDKVPEAIVASSSVCSVNIAGVTSNDTKQTTKRRNQEGEESGYQSEDLEDESVSLKKRASGRKANAKRSRAAEVHNLSERRRRDRINEKMRSLQELIPNCNKVDKASMLDEAIEYLKTLQLQVQIMSMSTGLCMPPMMLPSGMQHLRPPPMAHFSPMGMNMRMGMGYGYSMGMMDMNGNPSRPPAPIPAMHGQQQFPFPSMPGAPSFHGMPGQTSVQMFGIPGQGFPTSNSRAPSSAGLHANMNQLPEMPTATSSPLLTADAAPSANSKDQEQLFMQLDTNTSARNSLIQTSSQAAKESFDHSVLIQMSNQATEPVEVET